MSDFLRILTHGRRLQGAVKELSLEELENVVEKLNAIVDTRKQKEMEAARAAEEKQSKLEEIRRQLEEAGLDIDDLNSVPSVKLSKRAGQKRPVKYSITDEDGEEHKWTGIGRMPKVFSEQLDAGKSLDDFKI
ncbi:H-NS histone family protein [Alteromonadaceae bacterium M269]|nr:H-NS histone family protein [Alteromonadaceae bacterium M269]